MDVNFLRPATIGGSDLSSLFPIPLANVASSGNNYIRFNNGIQICFVAGTMTIDHEFTPVKGTYETFNSCMTYPVPFSDVPVVIPIRDHSVFSSTPTMTKWMLPVGVASTQSSFSLRVYALEDGEHSTTGDGYDMAYFAIGRWK